MRIISGKYKNRRLETPKGNAVRPTSNKIKGAMFNILNNLVEWEECDVLDIFCGTGSLGIEALSRGARSASFVDKDVYIARENCENLQIEAGFIKADATKLWKAKSQFNLIFIDPPYSQDIAGKVLKSLLAGNWLAKDALIILEMSTKHPQTLPNGFEMVDERAYGNTRVQILNHQS